MTNPMTNLLAKPWDLAQRHWQAIGLLVVLVLVLALAGTSIWQRAPAPAATTAPAWSRTCVAGVSYLQFTSGGASVEWTPAGKVKTCSEPAK